MEIFYAADLIDGGRRKRIAGGSGTSVQEVNNLMKQFGDMRKMMKSMNQTPGKGGMGKVKMPRR